jgi:hypothetical protein
MAYLPLSTANLPDPAIDPAQGSSPEDYFGTLLFTATAGVAGSVTGLGFAPDFSWTKARNTTQSHQLFDNVRGDGVRLITNSSSASTDLGATYLSLEDDGIDYGSSTFSSNTYVAWNWKAGTSFSNSAGTNGASIASSGSANTDSGFSIVSYTGDSTGTDGTASTVYHGLSQAPEMIMFKPLDTYDGAVYHSGLTSASYRLVLFSASGTLGEASDNGFFNGTAPTSSVFSIGSRKHTNSNGGMIAYCFHSVEGYSKFGSYTGNGSTDGPFVYTGFRPKMLIWKRTDGSGQSWEILDDQRDPYNGVTHYLYPDTSGAENNATAYPQDFLSNGFKIRHTGGSANLSGGSYIYMAFAENPFKYSNAR